MPLSIRHGAQDCQQAFPEEREYARLNLCPRSRPQLKWIALLVVAKTGAGGDGWVGAQEAAPNGRAAVALHCGLAPTPESLGAPRAEVDVAVRPPTARLGRGVAEGGPCWRKGRAAVPAPPVDMQQPPRSCCGVRLPHLSSGLAVRRRLAGALSCLPPGRTRRRTTLNIISS